MADVHACCPSTMILQVYFLNGDLSPDVPRQHQLDRLA